MDGWLLINESKKKSTNVDVEGDGLIPFVMPLLISDIKILIVRIIIIIIIYKSIHY